jgi:hypothetical protein
MKWKSPALIPAIICTVVVALICSLEVIGEIQDSRREKKRTATEKHEDAIFTQRLEWMTYDWRVQLAAANVNKGANLATNLGFVSIDDHSVQAILDTYHVGLLWPRQIYGRLVDELVDQGAKAIGFDVLLGELRKDHPPLVLPNNAKVDSDQYFANAIRRAGNVVLAADEEIFPHDLFRTNAAAVANIIGEVEADGILRRAYAFIDVDVWHPLIKEAAETLGWYYTQARSEPGKLVFPTTEGGATNLAIDANGNFNAAALETLIAGETSNAAPRLERAVTKDRWWQLGIVLAARELNLDLDRTVVDLEHGQLVFSSAKGARRTLPVDRLGRFYIDWSIRPENPVLTKLPIEFMLTANDDVTNRFAGKLVVVGSTATGNNVSDLGATPLQKKTHLLSKHWNIANSLITGRVVVPLGLSWRLPLIISWASSGRSSH